MHKFLDSLKELLERFKNLLVAAGAVAAAALGLWNVVFPKTAPGPPPVGAMAPIAASVQPAALPARCYSVKVEPRDEKVAFSRAKLSDTKWFDLNVDNRCTSDVFLDVEFERLQGSIAIVPPGPKYTAPAGQQTTKKMPIPNLSLLNDPPQDLLIRVVVYTTGQRELIWQDTVPIALIVG
jgi:hypothetical protein